MFKYVNAFFVVDQLLELLMIENVVLDLGNEVRTDRVNNIFLDVKVCLAEQRAQDLGTE